MKKRQIKKNQTKLLDNLLSLSSQLQILEDLGVYSVTASNRMEVFECHMTYEDLSKLPFFDRRKVTVSNVNIANYPFQVSFEIGKFSFFCLMSRNKFIKRFPERIKKPKDYIEIEGVRYLKEVPTNE